MRYVLTIGGQGSRLKCLSPVDKHLLYWRDKRIVDWIKQLLPDIEIIGAEKTPNRLETLKLIEDYEDTCIVDCDIIPFGLRDVCFSTDTLVCFSSTKNKYGSVLISEGKVSAVDEINNLSNFKCSGAYFVKSVRETINKMKNVNSIGSGMIGADGLLEKSFVRMGDVEDYMESL